MDKFKNILKKAFSYPKLLMATHPVTAISIITATGLFALDTFIEAVRDYKSDGSSALMIFLSILLQTALSVLIFAIFSLCLESIRPNWSTKIKSLVFALLGVLSLFFGFIFVDGRQGRTSNIFYKFFSFMEGLYFKIGVDSIAITLGGLIVSALLLAIYFSYGHDIHERFNDHVINAYSNIFFTSIIYGVIQLGVLLLTLIVEVLLFDDAINYLPTILVIINGIFYAPAIIVALIRQNEKANVFIQVLTRYVMLIISLIAYAIIYIYIIKLVVTRSVPSNSVYGILTALFVISIAIAYMCTTFENTGFLQKFAYNSPLIFAPFIIMQCYTIIVRIGQYGITPMRYFGVAFILFEIVYIAYYTYSRVQDKEVPGQNLLLILLAFIVITMLIPGVSAEDLSTNIARHTLTSYIKKAEAGSDISDKEYIHANAAYSFLGNINYGKDRVNKYLPDLDEDRVSTLREMASAASKRESGRDDNSGYSSPSTYYCGFSSSLEDIEKSFDGIDISGYNRMISVRITADGNTVRANAAPVDCTKLNMKYSMDYNTQPVEGYEVVDLDDFCQKVAEYGMQHNNDIITWDEFQKRACSLAKIDIDENARLYIVNADINLNKDYKPCYVELNGYLLLR